MIVVEGFDCSGKTTLVGKIGDWTGYPAAHSGGPPKGMPHTRRCLARCLRRFSMPVIQDRVTQISESVYGMIARPDMAALALSRIGDLRMAQVVVYCRPKTPVILERLKEHQLKGDDTPDHVAYVVQNAATMIAIYDTVMCMVSHHTDVFIYDYTRSDADTKLQLILKGIEP